MEILVFVLAVAFDLVLGEPPLRFHPVNWFGKIISFFDANLRSSSRILCISFGAVLVFILVLFSLFLSLLPIPQPFDIVWQSYLLTSSISIRSMILHVNRCVDSEMSRTEVGKLVSRDTSNLKNYQLCSAVIESTAENFVDGVVAPLFYFVLFGVPGAVVYRAVNVCDSMIGYRDGKYEYFGKIAARFDDVLNFLPERLSLLLFEMQKRGSARYGLVNKVKLNGCTIPAMSYILGVKLEKPGYYSLPGRNPDVKDVILARKIFFKLSIFFVVIILFLIIIKTSIILRYLSFL